MKKEAYLLIFSASWCGPSKRMLNEIKPLNLLYSLIDVDKDDMSDLVSKYGIRNIPTIILAGLDMSVINKWIGFDDEDPGQSKIAAYLKDYKLIPFNRGDINKPVQVIAGNHEPASSNRASALPYKLEDLKPIRLGENLNLIPYDAGWVFDGNDVQLFNLIANTPQIRKYLPGLDFSTEDSTRKSLVELCMKTEAFSGFTYAIRQGDGPMGLIMLDSPIYNASIIHRPIWTIDFFMLPVFEHKGLMYASLLRIFNFMKTTLHVDKVYAIVDQTNESCINLVGNGLMTPVDNINVTNKYTGEHPYVFEIDLTKIRFEHR